MLNIAIRDLEVSKALDKKAMAGIFGGDVSFPNGTKLFSVKTRTEGLGTIVNADGHVVQRFRDVWINVVEDYSSEYTKEFLNSVVPTVFMAQ